MQGHATDLMQSLVNSLVLSFVNKEIDVLHVWLNVQQLLQNDLPDEAR
jgi:hypothetical protein